MRVIARRYNGPTFSGRAGANRLLNDKDRDARPVRCNGWLCSTSPQPFSAPLDALVENAQQTEILVRLRPLLVIRREIPIPNLLLVESGTVLGQRLRDVVDRVAEVGKLLRVDLISVVPDEESHLVEKVQRGTEVRLGCDTLRVVEHKVVIILTGGAG
jgi:hypothetical protein